MTQSSKLPDTLARLAQLAPKRVQVLNEVHYQVHVERGSRSIFTNRWSGELLLERALREEIESRGWVWSLEVSNGNALAGIFQGLKCLATQVGDTPAEALALALTKALEGKPHVE